MSLAEAFGSDNTFGVREPKPKDEDVEMEDLFGEDEGAPAPAHGDGLSSASPGVVHDDDRTASVERQRQHLEYNEDEGEPDAALEQKIEAQLEIPDVPFPRSSDGKVWTVRLPNYLKLDSKPFAPEAYIGAENDEDGRDAESAKERSLSIKLEVENTIRWRWVRGPDGQMVRQSNTRFIRWSDGSLSVQLGKELFDVTDNVTDPVRQSSQGGSQSQGTPSRLGGGTGGLTYLVAQHKRAEILQAEALVAGQMSIRPVSMQSDAHRKLVRAVSQRHKQLARLKTVDDRELEHIQKQQVEAQRKGGPRKQRAPRDPNAPPRRSAKRRERADIWSDDEQDFDDNDAEGDSDPDVGGSSPVKRASAKKKRRSTHGGDDGDRADDYKTDDFVVADTSDEDDDEGGGKKSKKKKSRADEDADEAPDELEQMEARLERREAERRKKAPASKKDVPASSVLPAKADAEGSEDMEVESEEEDDMPARTRKPAPGKRKVAFEDEEDE
ncbi:Leo1-domain-containing protein [Exidia glandulosa HHB12029]|uniref:Leo1-domain-containing protein n=1 Tax=Exidia glandulosa HHB12029 TaxID=1314781 RepID=A0A165KIC9_EXIGL|nr:Leo1-domain-containing protein [Exidia glandulosa HHB12029]